MNIAMNTSKSIVFIGLLSMGIAGCGAGGGAGGGGLAISGPAFPTKEELSQIGQTPLPANLFGHAGVDAPSFQLTGSLPESIGSMSIVLAENPWEEFLSQALKKYEPKALATESMRCYARQIGGFVSKHKEFPSRTARAFIAARCGSPFGDATLATLRLPGQGKANDADLIAKYSAEIQKDIDTILSNGPADIGIHFERTGNDGLLVLTADLRTVALNTSPIRADKNRQWTISGEIQKKVDYIQAYINRGAYSVAPCTVDMTIPPPKFSIRCEMDPGDTAAWVDVHATVPGRLLSEVVLQTRVVAREGVDDMYQWPSLPAEIAAEGATDEEIMTAAINAVRRKAGLKPLVFDRAQSREGKRLAPYYFASALGDSDPTTADKIALGMLAGWYVQGDVRRGRFSSFTFSDRQDPVMRVAHALSMPTPRLSLLDANAERVSLGLVTSEKEKAGGAMFATYELTRDIPHADRVMEMAIRLGRARLAKKKLGVDLLTQVDKEAGELSAKITAGAISPEDALQALATRSSEVFGTSVQMYAAIAPTVDLITFPDELIDAPTLQVVLAVADYRPVGAPWMYTVVLICIPQGVPTNSAMGQSTAG